MKRLTIKQLGDILEEGNLTEELQFNGGVHVYKPDILEYTGQMSLIPIKKDEYKLELGDSGVFYFKTRGQFKIEYEHKDRGWHGGLPDRGVTEESFEKHKYPNGIKVLIDIQPDSVLKIENLTDTKY